VGRSVAEYHDDTAAGGRAFELALGVYPVSGETPDPMHTKAEEEK
jgi:hypothetical protein